MKLLMESGWNGVVTLVHTGEETDPWTSRSRLPPSDDYGLEFVGEWEDIAAHAEEFSGKKVGIRVLPESDPDPEPEEMPQLSLSEMMAEVDRIQEGMEAIEDDDTLKEIREARSGKMYGYRDDD